jgi:hypothetical protein
MRSLTPIELGHLDKLRSRMEIDSAEIDHSLTYRENKLHLLSLESRSLCDPSREAKFDLEVTRWRDRVSSLKPPHIEICPVCHERGSGLHAKWVLNKIRKRYEPYYYMAHSVKKHGKYAVKWHYIKKHIAQELLTRKA